MRPVTVLAIALLVPSLALAQQPTTPPPTPAPTPAPVVVPPPTIPAAVDTAKPAAPAPAPAPVVTPAPAAAAPAEEQVATISPGMTAAEVEAAWGKAGVTRTDGDQTFLFYKNDCLKTCGTFDVVMLEGGKVVDAIVRASYHRYDGTSSSPAGTTPHFTRPPR